MKCPKCNEEMKELHPFLHHEKCENCGYEEEDIFIINEGKIKENFYQGSDSVKLTEFGKFLRKLRIDNEELLKDMAIKLNVTPSFLSMVETGRRSIPKKWEEEIEKIYSLNLIQKEELISILNRN